MVSREVLCALALVAVVDCTKTANVRPSELARLDGYDVQRASNVEPVLETVEGGHVTMSEESKLILDLPSQRVGGRFTTIEVQDGLFAGRTDDGRQISAPVDQVRGVALGQTDVPLTAVVVGGVLVVLAGAVFIWLKMMDTAQPVAGRPLRIGGEVVTAPLAESEGWGGGGGPRPEVSSLSSQARGALAIFWTENARAEHASVPAFSRLSLTLMSVGAPARLLEAAHRAALEEIEHARIAFALATAYAGTAVAPGALPELRHAPAASARSVPELARESLIDGCLNEGVSAAAAMASSERARDPALRDAWATLARDESAHAALAWDIVAWCLKQGDADLGRQLRKAIHTAPAPTLGRTAGSDLHRELESHGWLPPAVTQDLFQETRLAVASRLATLTREPASAPSV
jgi:hypothetical protein